MTILAIILGPIFAVIITLWYQTRKEKNDAKRNLFFELMAHRKSFPIPYEYVKALNLIDVVFADNAKVLNLWHQYYELLHRKIDENTDPKPWDHKLLELLSEMASSLGYKSLQQVDIDKFYTPVAHGSAFEFSLKIQTELLRVLENTSRFLVENKPQDNQDKKKNS